MAFTDPNLNFLFDCKHLRTFMLSTACCLMWVSPNLSAQDAEKAPAAAEAPAAAAQAPSNDPIVSTTINPKYVMPEIDGNEDRDTARQKRAQASTVRKLITNNKSTIIENLRKGDTSNTPLLDEYLNGYVFAEMGQNKSATLSQLGELRRNFLRTYLSEKIPANARRVIIEQYTIPKMQEFADGNYHKGVRMNAVVLLGLLNEAEGDSKTVPVPSKAAFLSLSNIFTDAKFPSYMKVGALSGLQRHFEVNRRLPASQIDEAEMNAIANQCVAMIQDKADGQDTWPEQLNYWLKRRATQTLGAMGNLGADGANAKAISVNLNNEDNPPWIRFDSLVALSKMKFDPAMAQDVGTKVIEFVSHFLEQEANGLKYGVDDLVTINLLYEDKDLLLSGSAKRSKGRDTPNAGMGFGEDEGETGSGQSANDKPTVELPTYQLNDSRKRVKAVVFTALQFFENDRNEGLIQIVADDKKADFRSAIEILEGLITDSDVGIVDLSKVDDDDETEEQQEVTQQLVDIYNQGAEKLDALVVQAAPAKAGLEAVTGDEDTNEDSAEQAETPPQDAGQNGAGGN